MLADALPDGVVELGRHVSGVEGSALVFSDGSECAFDAIVGADGIHSVVRAAIVGDDSPEFTGLAAYRALVPAERGAGVRAPAGLLDLARAAPALRALPGLRR